jgi:hypothetical protein
MHRKIAIVGLLSWTGICLTAGPLRADVGYPSGVQTFESMAVGADLNTLIPWFTVNSSVPDTLYTVVAADDVLGVVGPRGSSTRWLRVDDQDGGAVQNRFYSGVVVTPIVENYHWRFFINLEAMPPGGVGTKPRVTIQHLDGSFQNAWGIEWASTGSSLVVTGIGGVAASTPLYSFGPGTDVGEWVQIDLFVDFTGNMVSATANGGAPVALPINLSATADKTQYRFCYRGENTGNVNKMLIDDVGVAVGAAEIPAASSWGMLVLTLTGVAAGTILMRRSLLTARG